MAMIGLIAWQMATTSTSSEAAPEDCTPGPSPESILSKLKSPQLSDLSRKRKVATYLPAINFACAFVLFFNLISVSRKKF